MLKDKILLTGYSGFVGSALFSSLAAEQLVLIGRHKTELQCASSFIKHLDANENYDDCLEDVAVVIHCAARVHMMNDTAIDPLQAFREINVLGTLNLARQAAAAGVKRFIYLSSIKVNGEATHDNLPFHHNDIPAPLDAYGVSKAEAENGLHLLAKETGMELVIIRPPLIYGPNVKANFASMLKLARKNLPLPLGAINNKRSLVALDNLVDLIVTCIDHPGAANQTFLVSDDHDVSTTELLKLMTRASGKKPRLLPVPVSWLRFAAKLTGKQAVIERLCGNLQVDIQHTKETLGWMPPISVEEGIARCFDAKK